MEIFFPISNNRVTLKAGIENLLLSMVSPKEIICHYLFIYLFIYSFTYHLLLFIVPGSPADVQGYSARGMHASAARDYHLQERTGVLHHHSQAVQACTAVPKTVCDWTPIARWKQTIKSSRVKISSPSWRILMVTCQVYFIRYKSL